MESNIPTANVEAVATTDTAGAIDNMNVSESSEMFADGGDISGKGSFKLVYYLTFALLISASVYSIYYHRQALNKLKNSKDDELKKNVKELKYNLKKLMRNKYEVIS